MEGLALSGGLVVYLSNISPRADSFRYCGIGVDGLNRYCSGARCFPESKDAEKCVSWGMGTHHTGQKLPWMLLSLQHTFIQEPDILLLGGLWIYSIHLLGFLIPCMNAHCSRLTCLGTEFYKDDMLVILVVMTLMGQRTWSK